MSNSLDNIQPQLFEDLTLPSNETWFGEILAALNVTDAAAWPDQFGNSIRQWLIGNGHRPIKTLSLFSGGGGLDIAFHDAGFQIIESVEIEKNFAQTLTHNAGEGKLLKGTKVNCIDIREYEPDDGLEVDFIIGGPPCQTFSAAGRRAAGVQGTDDARGNLFEEYVRLLKRLNPQGFLFENVYGIVGAQDGKPWQEIQKAFQDAGYTIFWRILDAADYGVPQHRERLFIVGLREGEYSFPEPTHGPDSRGNQPYYVAGEAVRGATNIDTIAGINGQHGYLLNDIPPGLNYSFYTQKLGHPKPIFAWRSKFSDYLYKADPEMPVRTIKAQGGQYTGPLSWENRYFSVSELKRLQTFPDDYEILGGRLNAIMQLGNSVPPQIGRMLALSVLNRIMGVELPFAMHYLKPTRKLGFRKRKRSLTKRYQNKASEAIAELKQQPDYVVVESVEAHTDATTRYLTKDFRWDEEKKPDSTKVQAIYSIDSDRWLVKVGPDNQSLKRKTPYFTLTIQPSHEHQTILGCSLVTLQSFGDDTQMFTALWKAFEEKLKSVAHKDDLVQFFGYYQYTATDSISMKFERKGLLSQSILGSILQKLTRRVGVGEQLGVEALSALWEIENNELLPNLKKLKDFGFEVRSHNTNPQISEGQFLVPYPFPTLTWRSIQLRKPL